MTAIQLTIQQLEAARDRATDLIERLREFESGMSMEETPAPRPNGVIAPSRRKTKTKRGKKASEPAKSGVIEDLESRTPRIMKPAAKAQPFGAVALLEKPESVGAAMKALVRSKRKFTGMELRDLLLADEHTKKLLEAGSHSLVTANLSYWAKVGHLDKQGDSPLEATYTLKNPDFFAP